MQNFLINSIIFVVLLLVAGFVIVYGVEMQKNQPLASNVLIISGLMTGLVGFSFLKGE